MVFHSCQQFLNIANYLTRAAYSPSSDPAEPVASGFVTLFSREERVMRDLRFFFESVVTGYFVP